MRKNNLFLFSFLFLLVFSLSSVSAVVDIVGGFPNSVDLTDYVNVTLDLGDYVADFSYDRWGFLYVDGNGTTVFYNETYTTDIYYADALGLFNVSMTWDGGTEEALISFSGKNESFVVNPFELFFYETTPSEQIYIATVLFADPTDLPTQRFQVYPTFSRAIPDIDVGYNGGFAFNLQTYCDGFTYARVIWYDNNTATDYEPYIGLSTPRTCYGSQIEVCLGGTGDDIGLEFYSNQQNFSYEFELWCGNTYGWSEISFNVSATDDVDYDNLVFSGGQGGGEEFLTIIARSFFGLFPDSDDLTTSGKFAFVFTVLALINGLIFMFTFKTPFVKQGIIIGGFLSVFFFFFMLSLGFIPISVLIIAILFALAFGLYKLISVV